MPSSPSSSPYSNRESAIINRDKSHDASEEARAFRARRETLSPREAEVFDLMLEGAPAKVIATRLGVSNRTAEHHRSAVLRKLQARSISHLMRMGLNLN